MIRIATITNEVGRVTGIVHGPDWVDCHVTVAGKKWRFDCDKRMGPLWIRRDGTDCDRQNPPKAVWRAFNRWYNRKLKEESK